MTGKASFKSLLLHFCVHVLNEYPINVFFNMSKFYQTDSLNPGSGFLQKPEVLTKT